jgi:hypothetical protein
MCRKTKIHFQLMRHHMKKIFLPLLALLVASACVDDYTDANPRRLLDAPTLRISGSGNTQKVMSIPLNRFQNGYLAYAPYGTTASFTVSVIDAPGKIGSITVTPSVPEFGTVTLDESSVSAIQGQEQGEFTFTFTPNPELPDLSDRALNLVVSVSDAQVSDDGEASAKTTTLTLPVNVVACISESLQAGVYRVTSASGNLDGGTPYTLEDLEADSGGPIEVTITNQFPGRYTIDEVTGGVWPTYYGGRANPALSVDVCDNSIEGHPGEVTAGSPPGPLRTFVIDGTVNGDGTVTITWSYFREDAPTPALPAQGTYTLTKQ